MIPNRLRCILLVFFSMVLSAVLSASSFGQFAVSVSFAPPALPVYEQPLCPGEGYFWTPGYWAYDADDYFWVPGTWVLPPEPGLFWTPGYWAWGGDGFTFYDGYWATGVGFYGGINYGFGYFGEGYQGGRWDNGRFFYNRAVNNVNVTNIHNVYNTTVINNTTTRVSYNGGNGGITARPRPDEERIARERHIAPVAAQAEHLQAARSTPEQRASTNRGKPPVAATGKPGDLRGGARVPAKEAGAPYNPERNQRAAQPQQNARPGNNARPDNNSRPESRDSRNAIIHAGDIPRGDRPSAANSGDPKADRKYQQQQEKLQAKQEQEQQKLQRKQEQDHQKMAQRNADDARKQQTEQQHQRQTQQLQQRHEQQQQRLQQRMPAPPPQRNNRPNNPGEKH